VTPDHKAAANEIKKNMATYADAEDLINIGAYVKGSSADIDLAIDLHKGIDEFLVQTVEERFTFVDTISKMKAIVK